ncbi:DUF2162 domain-containing protein [Thermodesulfovibrionales bacterium]|nr:DUF2162 domain-containing protein [Thermodesulfovibrionales bacterium]MCL0106947.1 DUF2162 domain-containing protein [Thermodesulfovibrionales bacterium]
METYIAYANSVVENEPGLSLWLAGLAGVILFSIKIGAGSGLAGLSKREFLATIASYSLFVAVIGAIAAGGINLPAIFNLVGIFPGFYAILAIFMLAAGIYTVKSWQKGVDLSKKSFLPLIAPCPLLLVAIMLATGLLPGGAGDLNNILVGLLAGIGFFAVAIVTYYCVAKKAKGSSSPLVLGNLMIAVGLGLFAVVLILPTYFAIGLDLNNSYSAGMMGMIPIGYFLIVIAFFVTFVLLGLAKGKYFRWD